MITRTETHPLTDQISKSGHEVLEKISGPLGQAEDRLRETTYATQDNVRMAVKRAQENTREITSSAMGYVKKHPWISVGAIAAVGVIIGTLFKNRT